MSTGANEVAREDFRYSKTGRSVFRTVHLADGRKIPTRLHIGSMNLNGEDAKSAFDYAFLRKRNSPMQSGNSEPIHTVDLFSGCGGLSLGAMEACRALGKSFLSVAAVDKDSSSLSVYERNFRSIQAYSNDITELVDGVIGSEPTDNELAFLGEVKVVDLLLAGPPCQGYSSLNNYTRQSDERNILYERVARFAEIAKPKHVLIENIPTVTCAKEGVVQSSVDLMRKLGYNVDSGVIDLSRIGVPQRRKRHVVVASISRTLIVEEVVEKYRVENQRSVKWAVGDLENEIPNGIFTSPTKHLVANIRRIKYLHENDVYDLPNRLRPPCQRKDGHGYKSMYGRMKANEPSQTITTGFLSPGQGRFIHPTRLRTITPHEAARLQGFPDYFDFSEASTRSSLSRMIGNAAPMKLSYVFCLELLA